MRRTWVGLVVVGLLGLVDQAAAGDARAIIERAIQAQGGRDKLASVGGVALKVKGLLFEPAPDSHFTAEFYAQWPDGYKYVFTVEVQGRPYTETRVLSGKEGWVREEDRSRPDDVKTKPMSTQERKESETDAYVGQVIRLVPLLEDRRFQLSALGASSVDGHEADGVQVRSTDRPDVRLDFDQSSGQLVKATYWAREAQADDQGALARFEMLFQGYRTADPAAADEIVLRSYHVPSDGPALLEYLRRRTLGNVDQEDLAALVRRLGDRSFVARERAAAALVARGRPALPALRQAMRSSDPEVADRAKRCLRQIETTGAGIEQGSAAVLAAVVRLLGLRRPEGTARALLAYLPSAPDANVAAEARAALAAVAIRAGKSDPDVERALQDPSPIRRAAAEEALGRSKHTLPARRLLLEGVKYPSRVVARRNGQKYYEYEVLEIRYFTRFDPHVFARP